MPPMPGPTHLSASAPEWFVVPAGERDLERFLDVALPGVHEAGRPYVDWFFGGPAEARAALRGWMARSSSEVFLGRAALLIGRDGVIGGFVALSGAELSCCRQADAIASISSAGPCGRNTVIERIEVAKELFPHVALTEFYLSKIWVAPEARCAGWGAVLLRRYFDAGVRNGYTDFRLDVWSGNDAAIRLYRRLGFETQQQAVSDRAALSYTSMTAKSPDLTAR